METRAFAPLYAKTNPGVSAGALLASVTAAASTAAATVVLPPGPDSNQIMVANDSANWAFVSFGVAGAVVAAAVASGVPVAPNSSRVFSVDSEVTGASVILSAGTGSVIFTRGEGV